MNENSRRAGDGDCFTQAPDFLSDDVLLKPKLDSIFAEVENCLPSIDFEMSDVSSEEESPIFHRSLKTPTFDDEKLDKDSNIDTFGFPENEFPSTSAFSQVSNQSHPRISNDKYLSKHKLETEFTKGESTRVNVDADQNNDVDISNALSRMGNELGINLSGLLPQNISSNDDETGLNKDSENKSSHETIDERTIELEITCSPRSPRFEKRKEVPELSPSRGSKLTEAEEVHTISASMKNKRAVEKNQEKSSNTTVEVATVEKVKKEKYTKETSGKLVSQYFAQTPQLNLESVDLDKILLGIVTGTQLPGSASEMKGKDKNEPSLIQKLAQASLGGTEIRDLDPETGAVRKKKSIMKEFKTAQNEALAKQASKSSKSTSMGTSTSDLANLPMGELSPRKPYATPEKKTVFIDLRNFEQQNKEHIQQEKANLEKVQRILGIKNEESDSSSESEDEQEAGSWHEQRRRIKESLSRTGALPPSYFEGKQKKPVATPARPAPVAHTQAQRLEVNLSKQSDSSKPVEQASETMSTTEKTTEVQAESEKEKQAKRMEAAKKLREQREAERQSRIRLGKRLEALRPTTSSKAKQDPAENTHTLFDVESSYEPSPLTLPSSEQSAQDLVLLSVHLVSTGEVVIHRSSTNKNVDTGLGLSATYTSLITWLLSLVPDQFPLDDSAMQYPAPFHVLGLQQIYLDDSLVLYVAIKPVQNFDEKTLPDIVKKSKKREELKALSPFQRLLTSYLSHNTLHTVCHWMHDLVSMSVTSPGSNSFTYKPPLPNITSRPLSTFIQVNQDPKAVQKVFGLEMGFFWETVDSDEQIHEEYFTKDDIDYETQNTMSLVYKKVFRDPRAMMGIFNRVLQEGLDLAGIRLLYPTPDLMSIASGKPASNTNNKNREQTSIDMVNSIGPVLSLALRGTFARTLWLDAVGPSDPVLARKTDPKSLCALFGGESRDESLIFCPRNPSRVNTELCRWFSGRVPASGVINTGTAQNQATKGKRRGLSADLDLPACKPPAGLTAVSRGDVFIVVSPLVPVKCMGLLLATCQRRGYQMRGIRRMRLNAKKASMLGIAVSKVPVFSVTSSTPASPTSATKSLSFDFDTIKALSEPPRPCSILLLNKENAMHSTASLIEAFMVQMSLLDILGDIQKTVDCQLTSADLFHVASFSDQLLTHLSGDFTRTPDADPGTEHGYIAPKLHSNPEIEEIVVLTLTGHAFMKNFGLFLGKLQNLVPYSRAGGSLQTVGEGFELLGIKWLPSLSGQHAKQLTPYEVGHKRWKPSIQMLTSEPAIVLVLRGVNAFNRMEAVIAMKSNTHQHSAPLDRIMSPTPELAYLQAAMFFKDHELFADIEARTMLPYMPPPVSNRDMPDVNESTTQKRPTRQTRVKDVLPALQEESIFKSMQAGERPITTVLIAKPDVARKHLARLLKRITHEGFRVVALRALVLDEESLPLILSEKDLQNEMLKELHRQYLTHSQSVIMCLQRENAVKKLLDLIGPKDPRTAKKESSFYWRGMFGIDPVANGLHCSEDYKTAVRDTNHFFPNGVCCQKNIDLIAEQITCPGEDELAETHAAEIRVLRVLDKPTHSFTLATSGMDSGDAKLAISSLTQTNCIVLSPLLLKSEGRGGKSLPYVHIIEYLTSHGFELVGARMIWMTQGQAEQYLHLIEAGNFNLVPYLTSGASLVLAVQRDNAVIAFDALLGSSFDKESIYSRYNSKILRPKNLSQANENLKYFFDSLAPMAQLEISTKA